LKAFLKARVTVTRIIGVIPYITWAR
jgi:hypothetical protein